MLVDIEVKITLGVIHIQLGITVILKFKSILLHMRVYFYNELINEFR